MGASDVRCGQITRSAHWLAGGWLLFLLTVSVPASAAWVRAAQVPAAHRPGDLGTFVLQNVSNHRTKPTYVTFGTVFTRDALQSPKDVAAHFEHGRAKPVQVDAKTHYSDGSVRFAVVTVAVPPMASNHSLPLMLVKRAKAEESHVPSLKDAIKAHDLRLRITFYGARGAITLQREYDIGTLFRHAKRKGLASSAFWRRGPIAKEVRIQQHVVGSLRLVADLTAFSDGSLSADVQFDNDIAMSHHGGTLRYSVRISCNGTPVFQSRRLVQHQYQTWHYVWRSSGRSPINVVHNVPHLERVGAIPNYQTRYGVPAQLLRGERRALQSKKWGKPLVDNGVTKYMPMTGGRPDIGPLTEANATWLITQNAVAAAYALGQADTAGAVPWHFYLPHKGRYLTTLDFPRFWADPRAVGRHSGVRGLTQPFGHTKWHLSVAHLPSLAYVPYLLTGRRYFLDQLNAEAIYSIVCQWPVVRRNGRGIIVGPSAQLRGAAWGLREVAYAAYANPSRSYYGRYFRIILHNNIRYLKSHLAKWTRQEGQTYGYIFETYGHRGTMPPWQQDFFATTAATIARIGIPGAKPIVKWQLHFLSGSLKARKGWNPHDGIAYNLRVFNPHTKTRFKTWAKVRKATEAIHQANGTGWSHSKGYYGMVRMAALASVFNVTGSREALKSYRWVRNSGAPGVSRTERGGLAYHPQYWIVPNTGSMKTDKFDRHGG